MGVKTVHTFDTIYSADSCEAVAVNPQLSILATGTYQVNKLDPESESPKTERLGRIYLHAVSGRSDSTESPSSWQVEDVSLHQTMDCPAVLDMKWKPQSAEKEQNSDAACLAVATAEGSLQFYSLIKNSDQKYQLEKSSSMEICDGLALALEWSNDRDRLVVSDSKGNVNLISSQNMTKEVFSGHGYECWTCCFSNWSKDVFFSGGDDCSFNMYDVRAGNHPQRKNSKIHSMGVTSMLSSRRKENELFTGSYDEQLRVWDERNLKSELTSFAVGGGLWRIKQHQDYLLIGGMHGGFLVLEDHESDGLCSVEHFTGHDSLAYGADWLADMTVATASFYDHLMKIWTFDHDATDVTSQ